MASLTTHPAAAQPRERAPLLAFWGEHLAPIVAGMVTARPSWGARLLLAPREAQHAIAAYLRQRMVAGAGEADAHALAATVDGRHVRDLLREAVPETHPRLYTLLERCGPVALDLATYHAINRCLHGPLGGALLKRHLVVPSTVALVQRVMADPVLAACAETIIADEKPLANFEASLALLRAYGLAHDIKALQSGSGWRAAAARVANDLGRAQCPVAPFAVPSGWHQPRHWAEVKTIGRLAENCLGSPLACVGYVGPWISGRLVILCAEDGTGLATVNAAGGGMWWLSEINLGPSVDWGEAFCREEALRNSLVQAVAASGGSLLDADPWSGLGMFLAEAKR